MHQRDYTASGVVEIPKLEARAALVLGEQLVAAARPHKKALPKNVAKGLSGLHASLSALARTIRDQVGPEGDGNAAKRCDKKLDGAWGGLSEHLAGLARLEGEPEGVEAAELCAAALPNGTAFLNLPYLLQWSESEMHLQRIERDALEPRLSAIGGDVFLRVIRKAHKEYGEVLGVKVPAPLGPETPSLRAALSSFEDALRVYVVRVAGWADPEEPGTEEASHAMLQPLRTWSLGARRTTPQASDEDAPSGANDVTGDGAAPAVTPAVPAPGAAAPPASTPA